MCGPHIVISHFPRSILQSCAEDCFAILLDKHGGWEIPKEELEAIADVILPGIIKFFSTEEGRAEFEAWKKEQEQQEKTETEE